MLRKGLSQELSSHQPSAPHSMPTQCSIRDWLYPKLSFCFWGTSFLVSSLLSDHFLLCSHFHFLPPCYVYTPWVILRRAAANPAVEGVQNSHLGAKCQDTEKGVRCGAPVLSLNPNWVSGLLPLLCSIKHVCNTLLYIINVLYILSQHRKNTGHFL